MGWSVPRRRPVPRVTIYGFVDHPPRIATRTNYVVLGTWITPVHRHPPLQSAHDPSTLDHLSDGRVLLGAGLGTERNYTTFGEEWDPECIPAILRRLLGNHETVNDGSTMQP